MTTWVVAADASRARIFSRERPGDELIELEAMTNPEARLSEQGLVTDRGGAATNGTQGGMHGVDGEHEFKEHEMEKFAKHVAERLYKARMEKHYHKLYVMAAPSFLGLLRKNYHSEVSHVLAAEVDKNLTLHSEADIRKHLPGNNVPEVAGF
ncbi:hypothetical protein HMF8227_02685 [Saliniradius amylolyticus]|uniref:Protein required for attachment to host cells n=1 Tax=Saliniradius amylolyticus TaxID=2183582 RepID=A0A2S2E867_9ALTE|nr:host attachment protein [Saliniradius amylolyticus]AWL13137.1 hypothetical protein HMF8227_02685 [Saliniradius amylolyticus]